MNQKDYEKLQQIYQKLKAFFDAEKAFLEAREAVSSVVKMEEVAFFDGITTAQGVLERRRLELEKANQDFGSGDPTYKEIYRALREEMTAASNALNRNAVMMTHRMHQENVAGWAAAEASGVVELRAGASQKDDTYMDFDGESS